MFIWRGYKACISSQQPKLTTIELKRRYELAKKTLENAKSSQNPDDDDELTQIPETQFEGKLLHTLLFNYTFILIYEMVFI